MLSSPLSYESIYMATMEGYFATEKSASTYVAKQLLNHSVKIAVVIQDFGLAIQCTGSCFKSLPLMARFRRDLFIKRGFNIRSPDALLQSNKVTRSLLALCPLAVFSSFAISSGNIFAAPSSAVALSPVILIKSVFFQYGLAIHQNDHQARRRFVEWVQKEIAVVPDFHKRILFSDEAHFWLNGYVNKQNCRIWSEANPQVYVETPLHPEKLTVWYALWAGGIIGQYFFKNDEGHNVTVNGDRYRAIITNFFIPELNNHDVQELWFQQDGATCHTARATIDLLKDTFGDRLISRFEPVNWPPRSCDLTPLDYFLWGYVKSLVYADNPQTFDHLEDNMRRVIADIRPQMLEKVIEN
ncbi:putative DD41D transposase [Trichonephila clavipes]|nr:putative DD41D transposase [Trichonephila clavipes]